MIEVNLITVVVFLILQYSVVESAVKSGIRAFREEQEALSEALAEESPEV